MVISNFHAANPGQEYPQLPEQMTVDDVCFNTIRSRSETRQIDTPTTEPRAEARISAAIARLDAQIPSRSRQATASAPSACAGISPRKARMCRRCRAPGDSEGGGETAAPDAASPIIGSGGIRPTAAECHNVPAGPAAAATPNRPDVPEFAPPKVVPPPHLPAPAAAAALRAAGSDILRRRRLPAGEDFLIPLVAPRPAAAAIARLVRT